MLHGLPKGSETARRGLELVRVEDEPAGGPTAAGFGARGGFILRVRDLRSAVGVVQELARGAESGDRVDGLTRSRAPRYVP